VGEKNDRGEERRKGRKKEKSEEIICGDKIKKK